MFKYAHTMIRVGDLDKALHFYCEGLGFEIAKREDHTDDRFTLIFVRPPGSTEDEPMIELTHNWDTHQYDKGNGYGHVAYRVQSIAEIQARLRQHGYDLSWGPGLTPNRRKKMAFVDDVDGYEIELIEEAPAS